MSLFGNIGSSAQSQPAKTSNSFGNITASPATAQAPSGNLFGNLNTAQAQTQGSTGGLFGNSSSNAQPQAPPAGGLFANTNTASSQNEQKPLSFASTSEQPKLNLFGSLGTSQAQPQSSGAASGLFGNTQTSNLQPQQNPPFSRTALGSGQGQQQNQNQNAVQGQSPSQQSQMFSAGNVKPGLFDNLLEKGRKRHRESGGDSSFRELPSIQLNLNDIAKRARDLGGVGSQPRGGNGTDSKAHYLLAASGVNPGATRRDLDSFAAESSSARDVKPQPDFDPDVHKFLEQQQQQSTQKMISEGLERAHRKFEEYLDERVDINWELQRKRIYEHFGLTPKGGTDGDDAASPAKGAFGKSSRKSRFGKTSRTGQSTMNRSIFGQSSVQKSVIGSPGVGTGDGSLFGDVATKSGNTPSSQDDRFAREKQRKFAEKIQALNQQRLQFARSRDRQNNESFPLLKELQSVENQPGGDSPKQLAEAYQALLEVVGEPSAKERQFANDYLDETPNSAKGARVRARIIEGSRRSLERAFYDQLTGLVAKNPREGNIGGVPTAINTIRAYIRIRVARKDLVPDGQDLFFYNGDYSWPLLFFCLRSGLVKEAADYVTENATHFRTFDKNIITYLTNYASSPDRRLDRKLQPLCNNVFTALSKADSIDPYRVACYKIIGRCELTKRNLENLSQGVEDWIWLQFCLAREVNRAEEVAGDVFGLDEVRETIQEIGQRHFAKGAEGAGGYGTFFLLQILGGMFEQAISYLYSYSYVSAVHFAIALDYYGLLRVSDFSATETELCRCPLSRDTNALLTLLVTRNTKELPQISFGRMIGYYTRDFRTSNVESAVDYLTLICLNADIPGAFGISQAELCHEALRELVLETREFASLLGDIRPDGSRLKGAIEERLELIALSNEQAYLNAITVEAASVADDNGRTTDAVLLYHLSESYDNVILVINRALSEAIALDIGQDRLRLQVLKPRAEFSSAKQQQQFIGNSSLSLTSVDDPAVLARNMMQLYNNSPLYFRKIKPINREGCGVLLRMSEAKAKVAAGEWSGAIDVSKNHLIPLGNQALDHYSSLNLTLPYRLSTHSVSSLSKLMVLSLPSAPQRTHSTPSLPPSLATSAPCSYGPLPLSANSANYSVPVNSVAERAGRTRRCATACWQVRGI